MVNIRLAVIGKRPRLRFPSLAASRMSASRSRRATGLSVRSRPAGRLPGLRSRSTRSRNAPRRAGADPGARHHHGAVRARHVRGRALGRAGDHRRRCRMSKPTGSGHSGGDPQRAAGSRQRDGGRSAAHLLQHDDLRGARLLHRVAQPEGRADLAERRRRVALRRRPRRDHRRRYEALRRRKASSPAT